MGIDKEIIKVLNLRLAKGEISRDEYEEIVEQIEKSEADDEQPPVIDSEESTNNPEVERFSESNVQNKESTLENKPIKKRGDPVAITYETKSYYAHAFGSWILYYLGFYVVGFIVNLISLSSAKDRQLKGGETPGRGCLLFLIFTHFWLPLILIGLLIAVGGMSINGIYNVVLDFIDSLNF
jgi:hypothetical protein